jgi:hypothetical protein
MSLSIQKSGQNVAAGGGSDPAKVGGILHVNTTAVGTDADTALKNLMVYVLPANTLNADNKGLKITAVLKTAANGNDKTILLKFGDTMIDTGAQAWNAEKIVLTAYVFRTGAGTQDSWVQLVRIGGNTVAINALTNDETGGITIQLTGQNGTGTANDIVAESLTVEFLNN